MLKGKQIPPVPAQKPQRDRSVGREREKEQSTAIDPNHWSLRVSESLVAALPDESLHVTLLGGADNGYFLYLDDIDHNKITHHYGRLESGNIVLEVQGQRIAGYTLRDAMIWLKQVSQNGIPVMIKSVKPGQLPKDLRQYLGSRFPKGSIDHDLQQTIRDNLYLRTVPCTTREPRPGEVNGVDYTFLTPEQFQELEKSGSLLESGIFDGNLYGTPKPPKDPQGQIPRRTSSVGSMLSGTQPSSESKRRQNSNPDISPKSPVIQRKINADPPPWGKPLERSDSDENLGPLPANWEMAFTDDGHKYFIDHNTEQTHWLDPRLADKPEPLHNELPFGWEKVEDPHYGTYYIDHVNRKTQYEHPATALKKSVTADELTSGITLPGRGKNGDMAMRSASDSDMTERNTPPAYRPRSKKTKTPFSKKVLQKQVFVKNPEDLHGDIFKTRLLKGERGLGFTIIGGDRPDEEFLHIKNVVKNGPAYVDGKLQTGDVIVHINDQMVLGFTHQDVVQLFQTIQPGDYVDLEVCRGYPLPFDPDDPNTEIITTIAVGHNDTRSSNSPVSYSSRENVDYRNDMSSRSLKSLPELVKSAHMNQVIDYSQSNMPGSDTPDVLGQTPPEILTIDIVRGDMGFGFTIADSAYGQKVKQILDRSRCKNLQEGDFIQQINGVLVGDMNHSQVVQVLKDCPIGVETRIIVQRGGLSLKGWKSAKVNEDNQGKPSSTSNQPGAYFFNGKSEKVTNTTGEAYMNMSRGAWDELNSSTQPPEMPMRPRTPNETQRPKTPSETRPKTPTRLALHGDISRPKVTSVAAPHSVHLHRKEFLPPDNSREYANQNMPDTENVNIGSRPPLGPKFGPIRSDTGSRSDFRGRANFSTDNSYDRDPYGRGDSARPGQFRSRTPGPELMMQRSKVPDNRPEPSRPKTPTASDMRSKMPVPGLYGHVPGGNPDFSRNTHLQNSWAINSSVPQSSARNFQGSGIPENSVAPHMQRRDMMDTLGRMTASAAVGAGRPPRPSSSFEQEEPSPSNINRISRRSQFQNASLSNQLAPPQSPKHFHYPGNADDNLKFTEFNVTLQRQESGFGFRIIGGTEEGSQVAVGHIVPGGAADQDGRLQTGDEILFCDGVCVISASHHKVVQLMGNAGVKGQVSLRVRRRISPFSEGYPYDVVVTRRENEGFGFVIISSITKAGSMVGEFIDRTRFYLEDNLYKKNLYPWIGRILENSPAERCGQLCVGDRILAVNNVDISHLHHEDIVNIIKESGYSVTLTVGPPLEDTSNSASNSHKGSQGSMMNAVAFPALNDTNGRTLGYRYPPPPPPKDVNKSRIPSYQDIQEDQIYIVDLNRGHRGFGFSIRGGQEFNNMPLFVLRIAEGGAADVDQRLRVGDQLLEINGYSTENMTHSEAIDIIQNGGPTLRLLVRRTGKPPPNFDPTVSPALRYHQTGPMTNGPIGQSSPYLGRRNPNADRDEHFYYNQPTPNRTYLN